MTRIVARFGVPSGRSTPARRIVSCARAARSVPAASLRNSLVVPER
nr:hypothetical protein [Rhodococcus sp. 14C212]